jgi:transposase
LRVVAAVKAGTSRREAAKRFGVSASSAVRWVALERASGTVAAAKFGGHCKPKLLAHRDLVRQLTEDEPDLTLQEMRARLAAQGVVIGYGSLWRFLDAEDISFKKNVSRQRAGQARRGRGARRPASAPGGHRGGQAGVRR